ncbi:alkaline phosphatase family protein [Acrocarpospora catenulata]|uniref:alkaline phosphatase family protein n=1 Tax=Acrocarpospora catenulata TaxID=2836182 RepID=UPI001BDAC209|nr:alkaline phosphatase family protein [Acrocarpospora catenulata]
MPARVLAALGRAERGVVVLAVDGLSWETAATAWRGAELDRLTSTFPSTSATAWMSSITGAPVSEHLVVGAAYRAPADGSLINVITGQTLALPHSGEDGPGRPSEGDRGLPTLFERAAGLAETVVVGRELDTLTSPWAAALTRGARRAPHAHPLTTDPEDLVAGVIADVAAAVAAPRERPLLLWVYVNLDDHVHRHGYDARAMSALRRLERQASAWAAHGWQVLAYADHGQVPVTPDAALAARWAALDTPELCALPGGGAGRVRWLYPRPPLAGQVAERLADALDGHALVLPAAALAQAGLEPATGPMLERLGAVVAVATSPRFPVPDPGLAYEHGGWSPEEMLVPLARWAP